MSSSHTKNYYRKYPGQQPIKKVKNNYSMQSSFLILGFVIGALGLVLTSSIIFSIAILIMFISIGIVWKENEPQILSFCILYQFIFVITGFLFQNYYDYYPGLIYVGKLNIAILYSSIGILIVSVGIRTSLGFIEQLSVLKNKILSNSPYNIKNIFILVILTNSLDYLLSVRPHQLSISSGQLIQFFLLFRKVFFFLLIWQVFEQRKGYKYALIAFVYVFIPQLGSMMSNFKEIIFLIAIAFVSQYKAMPKLNKEKNMNKNVIIITIVLCISLLFMALYWEGGVKPILRPAYKTGEISGSPLERVSSFFDVLFIAHEDYDFQSNLESLSERTSSGVGYFSLVIERVPAIVPYENGKLLFRTFEHIVKPRFLFPDKMNLGVDSWLVREYAGIHVAGEELQTSVGLGYIAQFYIDFGLIGILILSFLYGCIIGFVYLLIRIFSPSHKLYLSAVVIILLTNFTSYEGEIAKLLGGLIMNTVIFMLIIFLFGNYIHEYLLGTGSKKKYPRRT